MPQAIRTFHLLHYLFFGLRLLPPEIPVLDLPMPQAAILEFPVEPDAARSHLGRSLAKPGHSRSPWPRISAIQFKVDPKIPALKFRQQPN